MPVLSWQMATQPLSESARKTVIPGRQAMSDTHGELYFARYDARNRLVTGGAVIGPGNKPERLKQAVAERLQRLWPQIGPVHFDHVWNGYVGMTTDFLPRIHRLGPDAYGWTGCNGRAVALSIALGDEVRKAVRGVPESELALPFTDPAPIAGARPAAPPGAADADGLSAARCAGDRLARLRCRRRSLLDTTLAPRDRPGRIPCRQQCKKSKLENTNMDQIDVAIVGTGWCGGIRADACAAHPLVGGVHIAENRPERLKEVAAKIGAKSATSDYRALLENKDISAVFVCATPETTHFPMTRDFLRAGKHVFLEKPIALELEEADELISIARANKLKFTIGYSQRFNPKFAYVKQCVSDGTIGKPVSVLVSRHISRSLGKKISGRVKLSPAAMELTHDLDFVLWCLEPAKPIRVYSQVNYGAMRESRATISPIFNGSS